MSPASPPETANGVGLAIALSILVLISAIMLASYACVRVKSNDVSSSSTSTEDDQRLQSSLEVINIVAGLGLEKPMIEAYPKVILGQSRRLPCPNNGPCSINAKDIISATCPVCRNSPLASPLSDLLPLAFNGR
ncbi:hypothetical protein LIER_13645 [Lithospermum erythrorhizon]|uniref:Uncharacterized protein n=1 Tax=Lithospermum erythrorhizon TaxID=34254 RepID=A0AAV3PXQ6_LITER